MCQQGKRENALRILRIVGTMLAAVAIVASMAGSVYGGQPAAPGQNKLSCSADGGATCTLSKSGTTATINTTGGGAAAVYLAGYNTSFYGVRVGQVTNLSFTYTGTAGVDPHWSIPIDTNHDGYYDY